MARLPRGPGRTAPEKLPPSRGAAGAAALPVEGSHAPRRKAVARETLPVCEALPGSRRPEPLRVSGRGAACLSFFRVFWEAFSWLGDC